MTLDADTKKKFSFLYPDIAARAARVYEDFFQLTGKILRCTAGIRSMEEQALLFAQGRTIPGPIVTFSAAGDSFHHFSCAFDSCVHGGDPFLKSDPSLWQTFGACVKKQGLRWGGDFQRLCDLPHAQLSYGLTLEELRDVYAQGGIVGVWTRLDQIRGVPVGSEWASKRTPEPL